MHARTWITLAFLLPLGVGCGGVEEDPGNREEENRVIASMSKEEINEALKQFQAKIDTLTSPAELEKRFLQVLGGTGIKSTLASFHTTFDSSTAKITELANADPELLKQIQTAVLNTRTKIETKINGLWDAVNNTQSNDFLNKIYPDWKDDLKAAGQIVLGVALMAGGMWLGIEAVGAGSTGIGAVIAVVGGGVGLAIAFSGYWVMAPGIAYFCNKSSNKDIKQFGELIIKLRNYIEDAWNKFPQTIAWIKDGLSRFGDSLDDIEKNLKDAPIH